MYDYLVGRVVIIEVETNGHETVVIGGTISEVERENDGFPTIRLRDAADSVTYQFRLEPQDEVIANPDGERSAIGILTDFIVTSANPQGIDF